MRTETAADPTPADREITKRARRALPLPKRTARSGKVSYTFQIDAGTKPDGSRDREHTGPAGQDDLGCLFGRVARQPPCATQYARRLPRSPQAGYRPPRHSAVTTPRHPTPRRAGDAPTDRPTDSPARQARTP